MDYISQLPKSVLSYILTKLSTRDLFKTSVLSKWWFDFVVLPPTRDLNFDIHNMLGSEKELVETGCVIVLPPYKFVDLDRTRDEFVKRVDQFLNENNNNHFQVDSFLLNFHLHHHQTNFIDQWLSFAIARGVASINLHFKGKPYRIHGAARGPQPQPYKFPLALFFGGGGGDANANAAAATYLKHLSLQYCILSHDHHPNLIIFKNLRSLTLDSVKGLDEMFITTLLSNSPLLEKLCLLDCEFISLTFPEIVSSSLCHFEVDFCKVRQEEEEERRQGATHLCMSFLDCPKLTSLMIYGSMPKTPTIYINTPMLNHLDYLIILDSDLNAIALFATLPKLEILHLQIGIVPVEVVASSLKTTPLKHLKQLNIIINATLAGDLDYFDVLGILTILQTSPLLQKLSVMVTYPELYRNHPELYENRNDLKDIEMFSHDEVKVIELGGCVGNCYEAEFVKNVLKYAHKLEQVVLSPYWKERGDPSWESNPEWFLNGRERIIEKLQVEEIKGLDKLTLI